MEEKKRVKVKEVVSDIKAGLSDEELREKHDLTEIQLDELFGKLVEAGVITQAEIDARESLFLAKAGVTPTPDRPAPITPKESWSGRGSDLPPGAPVQPASSNLGRNAAIGIIIGIVLTLAGRVMTAGGHDYVGIGVILSLVGFAVFLWGCYCLVKKKGYHWAWTLFGILGCIGLLVLLLIPDKVTGKTTKGTAIIVAIVTGVVLVAMMGIIAAIAIPYYISYKRTACNRAAEADVVKLKAAIERFATERIDKGCRTKEITPEMIRYMVGPYYGWKGTNQKCRVRVRVVGNEVQSCSMKGSKPSGPTNRYIYRVNLESGPRLPAKIGPCSGQSYGRPNDTCYKKSMLDSQCNIVRPEGDKCGKLPGR
jgi:Tfp pilus assembly major pilin PilA